MQLSLYTDPSLYPPHNLEHSLVLLALAVALMAAGVLLSFGWSPGTRTRENEQLGAQAA